METKFDIDQKLVDNLSKSIKTEKDLAALSKFLLKLTVERAMSAEMDEYLGYDKHAQKVKIPAIVVMGTPKKPSKVTLAKLILKRLEIAMLPLSLS